MQLHERLKEMASNAERARDPTNNGSAHHPATSSVPTSLPIPVSHQPQNQMVQASQAMQQQLMMQLAAAQAEVQNQLALMQGQSQFLTQAIAPMMADPNYMAQQLFSQLAEQGIYYGTIEENLIITLED